MKKHVKIYFDAFKYGTEENIPCELCNRPAKDIHHIDARGMGGSKTKDYIENLMALCRECHMKYGDIKEHKEWLKSVHLKHLSHVQTK